MRASLIVLGTTLIFLTGCSKSDSGESKLRTSVVERGNLTQTVVATGRIRPLYQIDIRSKSGGTVRKFYVEEGDWIEKGSKLFEITPEASPSEQVRAREELRTAKVEVQQTEDDLRIAKELFDKNLVPEQNLRDAERSLERARSRLAAAEAEWALIQREHVGEREGGDNLDIVQSSTTVVAPISGLIFTREVDEGASVTPTTSASGGTVVITMGDDTEIEFRGDVDEADIGKLKTGLPINLTVQAYPNQQFKGDITHISPVGRYDAEDQQTVFGVRAKLANEEKLLRVGLSATTRIVVDERKDIPIVDEMALTFKGDSIFVKIVTDSALGKTEDRLVTLGISDGIRTEITSGLDGGETLSLGTAVQQN